MSQRRLQVVLDLDTSRWTGRLSTAGGQLRQFGGVVNNTNRTVQSMSGSFDRMGRSMSTPLQKLRDYTLIMGNIRLALLNVQTIAIGWVGALIKQSAEVERLTILMKGMSTATTEIGRSQEAQNSLSEIMKMARSSGFAVQQLGDAFVKLKSGGLEPLDGSLKSLVNAVSAFGGTSESLHRASVAIQQMSGKGVISMEELRQQLGEAVPSAIKVMADAAGQSVGEFTKQVSLGTVKAGPALKGMFDSFAVLYAGSGAAMAETMNGQLAQVRTNMLDIANEFTQLKQKTEKDADGNITGKSNQAGQGDLYDTITKSVKDLNAALMSQEGKAAARELGEAVNTVAKGFIWTTKTIIEWRSAIGFALTAAAAGFVFLKSVGAMTWLVEGMIAGRSAITGFSASLATGTGPLALFAQRVDAVRAALVSKRIEAQREQVAANQSVVTTSRSTAAISAQIARLTALRTAYAQNTIALAQNAQAALAALRAGQATGRYRNFETGAFISQSRAIEINNRAHLANATAKVNSARVARQLAAAELALTGATSAEAAATTRSGVAAAAASIQTNFLARAKLFAASAARVLAVAVNFALGPIGMIAAALAFAAYQAGLFTNSANAAAAAANRLASSIGNLADVKSTEARLEEITKERKHNNSFSGAYADARSGRDNRTDDARLAAEEIDLRFKLKKGKPVAEFNYGQEQSTGVRAQLEAQKRTYAGKVRSGEMTQQQGKAAIDAIDSGALAGIDKLRASYVAAGKSTHVLDGLTASLTSTFVASTPAFEEVAASMGGGKGGKGGVADGASKAEKAVNAAAKAAENAREKYRDMIGNQAGELAELNAEILGGEGALAKFNARVTAGLFKDASAEELVKLAEGFKLIDEAQEKLSFNKSIALLGRDISQTTAEADQLWASLRKGANSFETETRAAEVKGRFADRLDGLTDPAKIALVNAEIEKAINALNRIDAANASRSWEVMSEEIKISLMGENEAREANYNAEIERQRSLIDWERLKGQEKIDAERRFEAYRIQAAARLKRESESSTVKMARDWAKLGSNIDQALSGALGSFVDGMFEADFNFGKFTLGLIKNLIKIILQAAIAYAILSAIGMANNSAGQPVSFGDYMKSSISAGFGGSGNAPNTTTNIGNERQLPPGFEIGTYHTGGIIGSSRETARVASSIFNNAKTFHNGGMIGGRQLQPGEVPIIGMKGEQVLTEAQQRAIGSQGGIPNVQVNIINNSGTDLNAEEGEPQINAKEMILNVVVEAASRRGPFRDAMKGMADG